MDTFSAVTAYATACSAQGNIYNIIRDAAKKGNFQITLNYLLMPHIRSLLERDGYKITVTEHNDGQTIINWYLGRDPL